MTSIRSRRAEALLVVALSCGLVATSPAMARAATAVPPRAASAQTKRVPRPADQRPVSTPAPDRPRGEPLREEELRTLEQREMDGEGLETYEGGIILELLLIVLIVVLIVVLVD